MSAFDMAVTEVAQGFIECAETVVERDTEGRAVTTDLYRLGLNAASRHRVHPVRVLTAVIDLARGLRDYYRGPMTYSLPRFGTCVVDTEGWWNCG